MEELTEQQFKAAQKAGAIIKRKPQDMIAKTRADKKAKDIPDALAETQMAATNALKAVEVANKTINEVAVQANRSQSESVAMIKELTDSLRLAVIEASSANRNLLLDYNVDFKIHRDSRDLMDSVRLIVTPK